MKHYWLILFSIFTLLQCARQTSPTGGPKDEKPPHLVSSNPTNNQLNFKEKQISLTFSEDIKLKNPKDEIISNPPFGNKTSYYANRKTLTIIPENEWEENTTYNIIFQEAVQDLTEGNPTENLHLAFSTGSTIDSLFISGKVEELLTNKVIDNATVAVYTSDTFDIFQHKPRYFTKSNKKGFFQIRNLKEGQYGVYAFNDKNKNLIVDSKSELYGFVENFVQADSDTVELNIPLFLVDSRIPKVSSVRNTETISIVSFNKLLPNAVILDNPFLTTFGENYNELHIYHNGTITDSLELKISATDSIQQHLDTAIFIKPTQNKYPKNKFTSNLITSYNSTNQQLDIEIQFNKHIIQYNNDSCFFQLDTLDMTPITKDSLSLDTLNKKIKAQYKIDLADSTKTINVFFHSGAFISIDSDSTKTLSSKIPISKKESTGTLIVQAKTTAANYYIRLYKANKFFRQVHNKEQHTFEEIPAGKYTLYLHIDDNNDGQWNPGIFYNKTPAEKMILYKSEEGSESIPIRANWEYGPIIIKE